jgi:hypothetical protein
VGVGGSLKWAGHPRYGHLIPQFLELTSFSLVRPKRNGTALARPPCLLIKRKGERMSIFLVYINISSTSTYKVHSDNSHHGFQ